jgi:hypothetical protein
LTVDRAETARIRAHQRQLGVLNRCRDLESQLARSVEETRLLSSHLETCRAALLSASSAAESANRQLARLRIADGQRLRDLVRDLVRSASARNERIGVFGAGTHTEWLLRETTLRTAPGLVVFDSNLAVRGQLVDGIVVRSVADMAASGVDAVIVSSLAFHDEMAAHLESLGLPGVRIVRCYP